MNILGLDLGGTRLKAIWLNPDDQKIVDRTVVDLKNSTLPVFLDAVEAIAQKLPFDAIGVGIPGTLDKLRDNVIFVPNLTNWGIVPLKKILNERYRVSVTLENDANVAALAEYEWGAGKGTSGIVLLTLGTGIGGGVVIDGNVLIGAKGGGAEMGHYCIDPNGPPCNCGSNGCLEVYTGRDGIIRRGTLLNPERIDWTPLDWSNAADKGDSTALQLWHETGVYLGLALAAYVNIFHPERIVLAGGVAKAGEKLLAPLRETVFRRAFRGLADGLEIVPAMLDEWAGAVGAALLAERERKAHDKRFV